MVNKTHKQAMILQMLIYIVKHCYVLVFWLFRMLYRIIVQLGFFFQIIPIIHCGKCLLLRFRMAALRGYSFLHSNCIRST